MIKKIIIFMFIYVSFSLFANNSESICVLKITKYDDLNILDTITNSEKKIRIEFDTIICNQKLNFEFFCKKLNIKINFPTNFDGIQIKNEEIVVWNDNNETQPKEFYWNYDYNYLSEFRFTYSKTRNFPCAFCSSYLLIYFDAQSKPKRITLNQMNISKIIFTYDDNDNIVQVNRYFIGKLMEQIDSY